MKLFENLHIDFMAKRKFFYFLSGTLLLLGWITVLVKGFQFGIDFKGGTEIVLQFEKQVNISKIRDNVNKLGLGNVEVKTFGSETGALIRTELQQVPANIFNEIKNNIEESINEIYPNIPRTIVDSTFNSITYSFPNPDTTNVIVEELTAQGFQVSKISEELTNKEMIIRIGVSDWIKENLKESFSDNPFKVLREDVIGPKVGSELRRDAIIAVFLSLIGILIYLAFRFKFVFAIGAVLALFHDVLITLGLFAALYNIIPGLNLEIDLTIVAAFLTLVGYSVNDTVIVFDRIRETVKIHKTDPLINLLNSSINRTMSRTIITGGTTLLTTIVLMMFGGEVLRAFAFTLFFGIIIGTYSSIFVASAFVLDYSSRSKRKIEF